MNRFRETSCNAVALVRCLAVVCLGLAAWFGPVLQGQAQTVGFSVYGGPQSVAITAGQTQVLDVLATPVSGSGFSGTVCVSVSGLPSGITFTTSASSCLPTGSFQVSTGIVTQITLSAPSGQGESVSQFTLSGAATGYATETANVELTVSPTSGTLPTDYVLTTGVPALSLGTTGITNYTFTVNATAANSNGFAGTISGAISGLPANVTASPATFTLTPGTPTDVKITVGTGAASGNSVFTVGTTSGSGSSQIVHNMPVVLNIGTQVQSFLLSTPTALSLTSGGTAVAYIGVTPVNGFNGKVTLSLGSMPSGVTGVLSSSTIWPDSLTPDTGNQFPSLVTLTLTGATFTGTTEDSITVTGTATGITPTPPSKTILLTTSNAATNTVSAQVNTSSPGTAFQPQFVGFSLSKTPFDAFTATATATSHFANLMTNFGPYVGLPLVRTQLESDNGSNVAALETDATYGSDKLDFFFTESSTLNLASDQSEASTMITKVGGSSQFFGVELDNEPDGYPGPNPDGLSGTIRPASWTFADYLNELKSYQNDSLTGPYLVGAWAGSYWIPGIAAVTTALGTGSGGIADFTLHRYAGCLTPDQLLLDEYSHTYYYDRFAGPVKTLGSIPVRAGEMNTSQCAAVSGGGTAAGDTFAESLWLIDTAFELNAAGASGFNLHSQGSAGSPATYDIAAVDGSGNITVRPPYYGMLFFAEAIQNGGQPLPVTMQQSSGNVKVWATKDSGGTVRVMVLEKDDDSGSKTVNLNLGGSYSATATQLTMSSSGGVGGSESGISIGGAAFNRTTSDGLLNGTPSTTNVTPSLVSGSYIYSITVNDGTATLLTIP